MTTPNLDSYLDAELDLSALVDAAGGLLSGADVAVTDERVSDRPDARTVRYYQSLGLVERPQRYEGRRAIYGYRQLVQVLVVKLLQREGHSLSQIQAALSGRPLSALESVVREGLGAAPAVRPQPVPVVAWTSVELAPGVLVSIDPRRIHDPDAVFARLARALGTTPGEQP